MQASEFNLLRSNLPRASIETTQPEKELEDKGVDESDPRFGLFADKINRFQENMALWAFTPSCSKEIKTILRALWPYVGRMKYFIWLYIFFGRPDWCRN